MTKLNSFACLTMLAAMLGLSSCQGSQSAQPAAVQIGQHVWKVELALDDAARARGMGGRTVIPAGAGMLFAFPEAHDVSFHMLDCPIPIDAAFIAADGTVVRVVTMSVEDDPAHPKRTYESGQPAQYVLETAGGALIQAGVRPGDQALLLGAAKDAAKAAR